MPAITTGNHPAALWPGVKGWFGTNYTQHPAEYPALFKSQTSTRNYEEEKQTTGFGLAPQKPEGAPTQYDTHQQGWGVRYTHVAYSLGYIVTREELADNLYSEVSMARAEQLAFSMQQTRENVAAQVYNRAFDTFLSGDGMPLLDEAHPTLAGSVASNILGTPANLSEAALEALMIQIMDATNARGLKISLRATQLIIPTALAFVAERILKATMGTTGSDTVGGGGAAATSVSTGYNNNINAIRSMGVAPSVTVNHYLTDSNAWFLRTNAPRGMQWFEREGVQFTRDTDFDTDNAKAKAYMRFSVGCTDWRGIYGTAGA